MQLQLPLLRGVLQQTIYSAVQWVGVLCLDANCNVQIFPPALKQLSTFDEALCVGIHKLLHAHT